MISTWPFNIDKIVIREGTERVRPEEFSKCRVVLKQVDVTSTTCASLHGYMCDTELEIQVGTAPSYLVDLCIQTMRVGEISSFKIYGQDCKTNLPLEKNPSAKSSSELDSTEHLTANDSCLETSCKDSESSCNQLIPVPVNVKLSTSQVSKDALDVENSSDNTLQCDCVLRDKSSVKICENNCTGHTDTRNIAVNENSSKPSDMNFHLAANLHIAQNRNIVNKGDQQNGSSLALLATIEITLMSFDSPIEVHHMTSEQLLERSLQLKETGVACFKNSDLVMAFYKFSRALKYLLCIDLNSSSGKQKIMILMSQCYSNMAACQLQVGHHTSARDNCTSCLRLDPQNVKALFRRAQACMKLGDCETAMEDLQNALELEPNNKLMLKCLNEAKDHRKVNEAKLSNALSKMFK